MITYRAINTINGKFYIGSTKNFEKRKQEHLTTAEEFRFQRALRKNPEAFVWEIFEDSEEEPVLEQALLDMWFGKSQCYNMSPFAGRPPSRKGIKLSEEVYTNLVKRLKSNPPRKGKSHTENTKQKIREKLTGQVIPDPVRVKISQSLTGKRKSEEHRKNISRGRKLKVPPKESKIARWVPEIKIWLDCGLSVRSIAKILNVSHSTVSRVIKSTPQMNVSLDSQFTANRPQLQ